jgi:hypothetical protein
VGHDRSEGATICEGARIAKDSRPQIIYIMGSRYPLSYWGEDRIDIGCESHPIEWWQKNYAGPARANHFSPEQIEEYLRYIELVAATHKAAASKSLE